MMKILSEMDESGSLSGGTFVHEEDRVAQRQIPVSWAGAMWAFFLTSSVMDWEPELHYSNKR